MKELLCKERYRCKMQTLLMKRIAYCPTPPAPQIGYPTPFAPFLQENLDPPPLIFFKNSNPL